MPGFLIDGHICLYREAMHLQCFLPMCYVRGGATCTHINVTTFTQFEEYRLPACVAWLYYASSLTTQRFPDNFFFLSCVDSLKTKKL